MDQTIRIYGTGRHENRYIQFSADPEELLGDYNKYIKYVKACEHCVRKDDRYTDYVAKVRQAGYNQCAMLGNLTKKNSELKLEMHHGPIFNLFDICDIVLRYHLLKNDIEDLTTYDIGDAVLEAHEKDWIQIVMLSKTAHKGAHFNIFIDTKATVGRIDKFIEYYHEGMVDEHYEMIERYIREAKKVDMADDNGLFDTARRLKSFK